MSKVENIEQEVQNLTPSELAAFRRWFLEFDAQVWDRQIEKDVREGRLDKLADEAWRHIALERAKRFEPFCRSEFLELLSNPAKIGSRTCG
ncbi:MAG: hypothetical protein GEU77_06340 [Deltaproteobacteria bacterium]|nr:hypothetical protein [Deltaproteobacteria bacterium]